MICAHCKTKNPDGLKYCNECGAAFKRPCASCAFENAPAAKFCGQCGVRIIAEATTSAKNPSEAQIRLAGTIASENIDGERKTVTALFADIKGSMELMEGLDPEEARAIVDPALKLMIDAVNRYDGFVVQSTGDGIFALFGAPIAHEDHPQRALYSALRMHEAMRHYGERLRAEKGLNLQLRIGVNIGEVVVRSVQTGTVHAEYSPIGHSTSLAARLQTLVTPGSTVITGHMRILVEGYFRLKALGPTRVKGVSEPVELFEVIGLGPLRTRLERAVRRGLTKFVGREREMEALRHAAGMAREGHGQIVAVMAEPGVGKSRLYYEFKAHSQSGWMTLEALSVSHGKASAYLQLIEVLQSYFRIGSDDDMRTRREKVTGRVVALDRTLEDALPYLFSLLAISEGDDPLLVQLDGQIKKRRTFEAIKRIILRETLNQPLVMIIEDLHWIDHQTQEFLNLLADSIGTAKLLLLVNYRPQYVHGWSGKTYYTQLRLDPLGEENAGEMLAALLGSSDELDPLKRMIASKTEGNPFFIEEMVLALFDQRVLVRDGVVGLAQRADMVKVPETVQAVIASRIDRLPAQEKELLQVLSVIGKKFPASLARALWQETRHGGQSHLDRMLDNLQLAEFIYEQPAVGEPEFTFKHALTQEVAYNSLLIDRRKALHEQVGTSIETLFSATLADHYDELARHFRRSGNVQKSLEYLTKSGQQAMHRFAYAEAREQLSSALELIPALPPKIERDRDESRLRLDHAICSHFHDVASAMSVETVHSLERAHFLYEEHGKDTHHCDVLSALACLYANRGEVEKGQSACTELLTLASELNDPDMIGRAHFWSGFMSLWRGDFGAAKRALDRAYELPRISRSRQELSYGGWQPLTRSSGALTLIILGYPEKALARIDEALALVRQEKDRGPIIPMLVWSANLNTLIRDAETVYRAAKEGIALIRQENLPSLLFVVQFWHARALVQLGNIEQGIDEMLRIEEVFARVAATPVASIIHPAIAANYLAAGRHDEGLKAVARGLEILETNQARFAEADLRRLKGELLLLDGRESGEVEDCFREAIAVARRQEAKWWELRATVSLARLLRDTNRRDEAHTTLDEIYNWFTEGFDTADLKDAKALLDELSA
jgi:class 3 adenylate cyclase/tetratricopeptide (TPR) repeat protein